MNFEAFIVPYAQAFTPMAKIEILRVARAKMLTDAEKLAAVTDYIAGNKQALWKAGQENLKRKQERNQSRNQRLSDAQMEQAVAEAESGHAVTLIVYRMLPDASEDAIDRETDRVYDAMEYAEVKP
jgi:hypothetical protein